MMATSIQRKRNLIFINFARSDFAVYHKAKLGKSNQLVLVLGCGLILVMLGCEFLDAPTAMLQRAPHTGYGGIESNESTE